MMVLQVKQSGDLGILTLDGELTVERTDELRAFLRGALDSANHVALNLRYVTEMDISCLHLLCSVYRTAFLLKKYFTLIGGSPGLFKQAMESLDLARCTNCFSARERCLWRAHFGKELSLAG